MNIFSNQDVIAIFITIAILLLWIGSCWLAWMFGHQKGYNECMMSVRSHKRAERKSNAKKDIRVLDTNNFTKYYPEAESVRVVSTHAPKIKENEWL